MTSNTVFHAIRPLLYALALKPNSRKVIAPTGSSTRKELKPGQERLSYEVPPNPSAGCLLPPLPSHAQPRFMNYGIARMTTNTPLGELQS